MSDTSSRDTDRATSEAGEGRWEQNSGQVEPGGSAGEGVEEEDAFGRDPADTKGHERNPGGELVSHGVQVDEKGHGDGELEERVDQVTGPAGVQRERELSRENGVYDPGRVGLDAGDDRNPSDPANYPNPADQQVETSRHEPELASEATVDGGVDPTDPPR